jgi:hypothetical protein
MTIDQTDRTVVTQEPTVAPGQQAARTDSVQQSVRTDSRRITRTGPGGS